MIEINLYIYRTFVILQEKKTTVILKLIYTLLNHKFHDQKAILIKTLYLFM